MQNLEQQVQQQMSRFNLGQQELDDNEQDQHAEPVQRSFITSLPPNQRLPAVNGTPYKKDSKRVLNTILGMKIWNIVQDKTRAIRNQGGNPQNIQNVMDSYIQWESQIRNSLTEYFSSRFDENDFSEDLHVRLAKELQALISKNIRDKDEEDTIKQDCKEFSTTLNFNSLFLSESCRRLNERVLKKLRQEIMENEIFKILNRYGENIYQLEYQFVKYYFTTFFKSLNSTVFLDILQKLIQDPFYSWTSRKDLNREENANLIQSLWLKNESPLFQLKKAQQYNQTKKRLIDLDTRKIEDYLLNIARFPLSRQELDNIRRVLDSGNLQEFFDKIRYIKDELKSVYRYVAENCLHYLAPKKEQSCLVKLQESNLFDLRVKLFAMLQQDMFNISDWDLIEQNSLRNTANKAQRAFKNQDSYFLLKQWIFNYLSKYFSEAFEPKKEKDLVRNELTLCLIMSEVTLKYCDVIKIVDELLQTPYTEVIQASGLLTPNHINELISQLQKLELFKKYSAKFKEDPEYIRKKAEIEISKIIDSLLKVTPDQKKELYQRFSNKPRASSIYQTPNICYQYKQFIFKSLSEVKQINDYIINYQKVQRTQTLSMVKSELQKIITNKNDYEIVFDYISINGEIKFENDKDCTVKLEEQFSDLKRILMQKTKPQNRKNLKQLQKKQQFIELMEYLPQLSTIYLDSCKSRLKYTIKNIIRKNYQLGEDQKETLERIIIDIIDYQDTKAIDENEELKDSNYLYQVSQIKSSKLFKLLSNSTNSIKANQGKYAEITLKNKIKSIYDHENLVEFSAEQKMSIINSLIEKMDFQQIKAFGFLNAIQQQFIINFIVKSEQYKQYQTYKNRSSNSPSKAVNSQLSSEKSEKVSEKKKNQPPPPPPRASEKKEEQSPPPTQRVIPPNPQSVSIPSESKKQAQPEQQFQDIIPEVKPPNREQLESKKRQTVKKWMDILAKYEKPLFKKEREAPGVNLQELTLNLLKTHPWTADKVSFFQNPKAPVRTKTIAELDQFVTQRGINEFLEDVKLMQTP